MVPIHSEENRLGHPTEDLQSIASILAAAISVIATNFGAQFPDLTVRTLQALMDTRLTAMRMENGMEIAMRKEIDELSRMTVGQLRQKYIEAFGEESRSNHKQF